ncbi:MAG: M28 family peptidase [Herpetosiphonaceae bacterium]|nr:M28 family peptidase [Herpetosiphonaceae bacterium]
MARRIFGLSIPILCILSLLMGQSARANTPAATQPPSVSGPAIGFAAVDPDYIYNQLDYMATHFLHRESGFDTNLPPAVNGHDELADYWTHEMLDNLQGFGPQSWHDPFWSGWAHRPAVVPSFNVEVTVPGAIHPEQEVVIGCHYDAMANSTQSANDDTSGCAIELGVAHALGQYWQHMHLVPARTLRFVIFDGEEQDMIGSLHYVNTTVNGDLSNIVAMINEEQNGVAYPGRFLGNLANPFMPYYLDLTPTHSTLLYPGIDKLPVSQQAKIRQFRERMAQAVPAVFHAFRELGYVGLTYHDGSGHDLARPIFLPDQASNIRVEDDKSGASDEVLFSRAGIPSATLGGDYTYYTNHPTPWAFPYDQPEDTMELLNTYALGGGHKSNAMMLSLAFTAMLTTWALQQPDILGTAPVPSGPLATISDVAYPKVNMPLAFHATGAYDPHNPQAHFIFHWNFGDGNQASGADVMHTYTETGHYTLTLITTSSSGTSEVRKEVDIVEHPTQYPNQYRGFAPGINSPNPKVHIPVPDDTLRDHIVYESGS